MRQRFVGLAEGWHKLGYELGLGIGISTGYATLGRIGFEGRYDYAAIGNAVILASTTLRRGEGRPDPHRPADARPPSRTSVATEPVGELDPQGHLPARTGLLRAGFPASVKD